MNRFYLDGSALGKRYVPEAGSPLVNHLLSRVAPDRLTALNVGVAEVASIIVRHRNRRQITPQAATQALADLGAEVVYVPAFAKVEVTNAMIAPAITLVVTHSVNSTDALVLYSAVELARRLRSAGDDLVLVSSDHQLLSAAGAEGLTTFNPETQTQPELDALIGP